jgi:drug/metabolite transporter (DMT)-like permease
VVVTMSQSIGSTHNSWLGQAAVVLACVFYAGGSIYARKTTEDTPGILRSFGPLVSATAVMWPAAWLFERPLEVPQLRLTWVALLFLGVLGSGLASVLIYYLIHEIGPTRATMVTYLFPLGGVILGATFLHEPLTWQLITGGGLIIASLLIANWQPAKSIPPGQARDGR